MALNTLILEDDQKFRKLLEIRLRAWRQDLSITVAESIAEGRRVLDEDGKKFQLIILDQHLPDGMGVELLEHPAVAHAAILAVSADDSPELPANAVKAGAAHFLGKRQIAEPLFLPLLDAILERKAIQEELIMHRLRQSRMATIKVLLGTLRHEINNPLGAVLGGAYIVRSTGQLDSDQREALRLIEESGQRIKHVINQLCEAADLEEVTKGQEQVFHVPGDPEWES
ncbi:MAG: response regulator [Bdellovibrionales bacterium]|nr:response regulator [Bdellovibrionales bacterium]